jgi:hypothetical protein
MANSRFVKTNLATTLGSYYAAPAADADFPAANALDVERNHYWMTEATPGDPLDAVISLGSAQSVDCMGLAGFMYGPGTVVATCDVSSSADHSTWTSRATLTLGASYPRDICAVLASPVSAQYWRFRFDFTTVGRFILGRFLLGAVMEVNGLWGPGSTDEPTQARIRVQNAIRQSRVINKGNQSRNVSLNFPEIDTTMKDQLVGLADLEDPFFYIHPTTGQLMEVLLADDKVMVEPIFTPGSGGDIWTVNVKMERLP